MRTSGDAIAYWMSCWSPVTRLTFTPGPRSSAYCVTDGPTVMPISLASTPCCASVASSTRPPSSAIRWSAFLALPRLRMVPGGRFHGPWCGTASSPTVDHELSAPASMKAGTAASLGRDRDLGRRLDVRIGLGGVLCVLERDEIDGEVGRLVVEHGEARACRRRSRRLRPMPRPPRPSPTAVRALAAALPVARAVALMTTPMERPSARSSADDREPAEDDGGADLTGRGRERPAHRRTDEPTGTPEIVDAAVDRRAPVRDVQDRHVGDEQRSAPIAMRTVGTSVGVGAVPSGASGSMSTTASPERQAPRPQQQDGEAEARDGDGDAAPAEDGAGAVGEAGAHRARRGRR